MDTISKTWTRLAEQNISQFVPVSLSRLKIIVFNKNESPSYFICMQKPEVVERLKSDLTTNSTTSGFLYR